ncbi:hypothetical protein GS982_31390 [Rhodococcus hoagii]|nr:hypothetical protein [Prescottella equi]
MAKMLGYENAVPPAAARTRRGTAVATAHPEQRSDVKLPAGLTSTRNRQRSSTGLPEGWPWLQLRVPVVTEGS